MNSMLKTGLVVLVALVAYDLVIKKFVLKDAYEEEYEEDYDE